MQYLVVNLGLDPEAEARRGRLPVDACKQHAPGHDDGGDNIPDRCDPGTWENVMQDAREMRDRGEKMDRWSLHEDVLAAVGGMPVPQAGITPDEKAKAKRDKRKAQEARLEAYEAEQMGRPQTAEEKEAAKQEKKRQIQERIAAKKAAKAKAAAKEL